MSWGGGATVDQTPLKQKMVTAQVGWTGHDRRRDFARPDGSWVKPLMMFQPCFLAVEKKGCV
jgi:hypothetical protein